MGVSSLDLGRAVRTAFFYNLIIVYFVPISPTATFCSSILLPMAPPHSQHQPIVRQRLSAAPTRFQILVT